MRILGNFKEALSEVQRDLAEMGVMVKRRSWQGQEAGERDMVKELRNYSFTVKDARAGALDPTQPWADAEFLERVSKEPVNPGEAYKLRPEVWEELREGHPDQGGYKFSYTYSERLRENKNRAVDLLLHDDSTRRCWVPISRGLDLAMAKEHRVPCSLGYLLEPTPRTSTHGAELNMTYIMRSCDWTTHFQNDVYLALKFRDWVIDEVNYGLELRAPDEEGLAEGDGYMVPGEFTMFIGNLHVFAKDVEGVF